jgi:hypothetical protein
MGGQIITDWTVTCRHASGGRFHTLLRLDNENATIGLNVHSTVFYAEPKIPAAQAETDAQHPPQRHSVVAPVRHARLHCLLSPGKPISFLYDA